MIQMELDFILNEIMRIVDADRRLSHDAFVDQFGPNPHMASSDQLSSRTSED